VSEHRLIAICQGNICRSPMAEVLFRRNLTGWRVVSAGLEAMVGSGAAPEAILALGELGSDLQAHHAQSLDEELLRTADLALTMTNAQKAEVERRHPWARGRVFRTGHWDGFDIDDPYQHPQEAFARVRALLDQCVQSWTPRLAALSSFSP
jgi:protein-tyrosine phosphatase